MYRLLKIKENYIDLKFFRKLGERFRTISINVFFSIQLNPKY